MTRGSWSALAVGLTVSLSLLLMRGGTAVLAVPATAPATKMTAKPAAKPAAVRNGEVRPTITVDKQQYDYAQQIPVQITVSGTDPARQYTLLALDTYNRIWLNEPIAGGAINMKISLQVPAMKGLTLVVQRPGIGNEPGAFTQVAACRVFLNVRGDNANRPTNFVNMIYGGADAPVCVFRALRQWGLNGVMAYEGWMNGNGAAGNDMDFYHEYAAGEKQAVQETDFDQRDRWWIHYPQDAEGGLRLCCIRDDVMNSPEFSQWKKEMLPRLDPDGEGAKELVVYEAALPKMHANGQALRQAVDPVAQWKSLGGLWTTFCRMRHALGKYLPEFAFQRGFNWYDPDEREFISVPMMGTATKDWPTQPMGYSIGDEISNTNFCNPFDYDYNPVTLGQFRQWLQKQYASLDALNSEWGTAYKTWDAVTPYTSEETRIVNIPDYKADILKMCQDHKQFTFKWEQRTPAAKRNYASWSDFRLWQDIAWADGMADICNNVRKIDRATPIGILGAQAPSAFGGFNYDVLMHAGGINWVEAYDICCSNEVVRSFNKFLPLEKRWVISRTQFPGGPAGKYSLWYYLIMRDSSNIVWKLDGAAEGFLVDTKAKEIEPTEKAVTLRRTMIDFCDGIGKAFMESQEPAYPINIYLSQRSVQAHWMIDSELDGSTWVNRHGSYEADNNTLNTDHMSWTKLLDDLGYRYDFAGTTALVAGDLQKRGCKVLILPKTVALSDEETKALHQFVEDGGMLIADSETGELDGHCKAQPAFKGALDDLFGIKRANFDVSEGYDDQIPPPAIRMVPAAQGPLNFNDGNDPLAAGYTPQPTFYITESGVQADGSKSLASQGGQQGMFLRSVGKGKTLYMAASVLPYNRGRANPDNVAAARAVVGNILSKLAGVQPYGSAQRDGKPVNNLMYRTYQFGPDAWLFGIALNASIQQDTLGNVNIAGLENLDPLNLKFNLLPKGYVYDARAGKYLGQGPEFTASLNPAEALVISVLPYKVDGVELTAAPVDVPGGGVRVDLQATLKSNQKVTARHLVRFETFSPSGQRAYYDTDLVPVQDGVARGAIFLSPNDAAGQWKFQAMDIHTGLTSNLVVFDKKAANWREVTFQEDAFQKNSTAVAAVPEVELTRKLGVYMALRDPSLELNRHGFKIHMKITLTPETDASPDGQLTVFEKSHPDKPRTMTIADVLAAPNQTIEVSFEHPLAELEDTTLVAQVSYGDVKSEQTRGAKGGRFGYGAPAKLTGDLNDPAWQKAPVMDHFIEGVNMPSEFPTEVRFLVDAKDLYIGIKSASPNMEAAATQPAAGGNFFRDRVPAIEVLLGKTQAGLLKYDFVVAANGIKSVSVPEGAPDFTQPWETVFQHNGNTWTAEARIPLSALGCAAPANGDLWLVNFTAYAFDPKLKWKNLISQYSPEGKANFNLSKFVPVVMESNPNPPVKGNQ